MLGAETACCNNSNASATETGIQQAGQVGDVTCHIVTECMLGAETHAATTAMHLPQKQVLNKLGR
jgi:hypothetical protein